jgi:hypothetical protein
MVDWSKPYRTIPLLQAVNLQEHADRVALEPWRTAAGRLSTAEEEAMLGAVQRLRQANREMARLARIQMFALAAYGMTIAPAEQRRILDGLRAHYGACVAVPSIVGVNPSNQLNYLPQRAGAR